MKKPPFFSAIMCVLVTAVLAISIAVRLFRFWHRSYLVQSALIVGLTLAFVWMTIQVFLYLKTIWIANQGEVNLRKIITLILISAFGVSLLYLWIPAPLPPSLQEIVITPQDNSSNSNAEVVLLEISFPDGNKMPPFSLFETQENWIETEAYGYHNVFFAEEMENSTLRYAFHSEIGEDVNVLFFAGPDAGTVTVELNDIKRVVNLKQAVPGEKLVTLQTNNIPVKVLLIVFDAISLILLLLLVLNLGVIIDFLKSFFVAINRKLEEIDVSILPFQRFWLKALLFLLLIGLPNLLFAYLYYSVSQPYYVRAYPAAMIDKHERLETLEGARIIFVGDSNLALGLDSEKVQAELGVPVINMGLFGSLRIEIILKEIIDDVNNGDIVILSFANNTEQWSFRENPYGTWYSVLRVYPKILRYLTLPQKIRLFEEIIYRHPNEVQRLFSHYYDDWDWTYVSPVFERAAFNEYGDLLGHLDYGYLGEYTELPVDPNLGVGKEAFISELNNFNEEIEARGGRVYYMFAPFPKERYDANPKPFSEAYEKMEQSCTIPVLGTPADFIFPLEDFYNTYDHLNRIGREKRTDEVIKLLKPVLQGGGSER